MGLRFVQVEEMANLLRAVPELVDRLEQRQAAFSDGVLAWLHQVERVLEANRLPAVSEVAASRALLLQANRGQQLREIVIQGRPSRRKLRDATASHVLNHCNNLLQDIIRAPLNTFAEAERISSQIAAVAQAKGHVAICLSSSNHTQAIACLVQKISQDPDTAAAFVHLTGLVGRQDAELFIDRAVPKVA